MIGGREASDRIKTGDTDFANEPGWFAVPKAYGDEIMASAQPEMLGARLWDIGKGKISRVLLGLANVSWLVFQVGSNAFLSGLFGRVGPLDLVRSQRWWSDLSPDERASLLPILGQSAHHLDFDRRYLGASHANGTIINAKRALEKTAFWQNARKGNPIDAMFKLDARQNLIFRRALLYSQAKRRMWERIGETTTDAVRLQDRIVGTLSKSADRQLMDYLKDRETLELHGRKVDELLGDYLTYTKAERQVVQRLVMFYGFVRHSTRLALWTLPTKHPITVAIMSKLALLGAEEAREILGGDKLPWGLGKFYIRSDSGLGDVLDALPVLPDVPEGIDPATGEPWVLELDLARMSPATNAFMEITMAEQTARIFPPFLSEVIAHISEKNLVAGRPWRVRGNWQGLPTSADPFTDYDEMDHVRVLAATLEGLIPPARYVRNVKFLGPQGDDASLLFGPAPLTAKDEDLKASVAESMRREEARGLLGRTLDAVAPFIPTLSDDPRIVRSREKRKAEAEAARERREMEDEGGSEIERFRRERRGGSVTPADELQQLRQGD